MSGSALVPVADIERMAQSISKSKLFGVQNVEQAIALMLVANAEGMHPALAARDFHVIQNRPALKADAMLARFQAAGGKVEWTAYSDAKVSGKFSHAQGGTVEIEWTIDQAKRAGLTGKDVWRQYPRAMLRARVISEGVRTCFPGVAVGVYTVEEVQDFDQRPSTARDMGAVEVVEDKPPVDEQLIERAFAAAAQGRDAFRAFWSSTPKQLRADLAPYLPELEEATKRADDNDSEAVAA